MPKVVHRSRAVELWYHRTGARHTRMLVKGIGETDAVRHIAIQQMMRMHESILVR